MLSTVCDAQSKLKDRLKNLAGQEASDFINRKKDELISRWNLLPETPGYERSQPENKVSNYQRQPVDFGSIDANEVIPFRTLIDFLPDDVLGYTLSDDPEGATVNSMGYQYSLASKTYSNGEDDLNAGIFDYSKSAQLLYGYTNQYEYESTDGMMKSIIIDGQPGYYQVDYSDQSSSLILIAKNRFIITSLAPTSVFSSLNRWQATLSCQNSLKP